MELISKNPHETAISFFSLAILLGKTIFFVCSISRWNRAFNHTLSSTKYLVAVLGYVTLFWVTLLEVQRQSQEEY